MDSYELKDIKYEIQSIKHEILSEFRKEIREFKTDVKNKLDLIQRQQRHEADQVEKLEKRILALESKLHAMFFK